MVSLQTAGSTIDELPIELGDSLRLRPATVEDIEALVAFFSVWLGGERYGKFIGLWARDLMDGQHPTTQASDVLLVEDVSASNGKQPKIVSALAHISQVWRYGGIPFKYGRPEIVATHPDYRRRGLVRRLMGVLHARSAARGELMQGITGKDWFYRQFGYEMAMNVYGGRRAEAADLLRLKVNEHEPYQLRPASTEADRAFIRELLEQVQARQVFSVAYDPALWEYEFGRRSQYSWSTTQFLLIERASGELVGFVRYRSQIVWSYVLVRQVALVPGVGYLDLLPSLMRGLVAHGKTMLEDGGDNHPTQDVLGVYFELGAEHPLYRCWSRGWSDSKPANARYIRIPDLVGFLRHVRPALERHLADSVTAGYSGELTLSFYRSGVRMVFERGQIMAIDPWQPTDEGQRAWANFPDLTFLQLLCGRRRMGELRHAFPDCSSNVEAEVLLDSLFPPFSGVVWDVS